MRQTNNITAQVFGSASEHILLPSGQALLTVSTAAFDYENLILSFDGTNYEVIEATPQTWLFLGAAGFQKAINASYTVIASDNGGTLLLNGNAFYQVTFNLPTSYPAGFSVRVTNADDSNGKLLSLSNQTMMLWPRQGIIVQAGSDGKWHLYGGPSRWVLDTDTAIYVSGGGNDLNDGLTPGTPLLHIQTAINLLRGGSNTDIGAGIDANNRSVTIMPAAGTYGEQLGIFGGILGANVVTIQGVVNAADQVKLIVGSGGQMAVHARDLGEVQIKWVELSCGAGSAAVQAEQGGVVDIENCIFGDCTGGNMVVSQDGGNVNFNGPCTLAGNAGDWIFCQTGGRVTLGGEVFTISGSINFTGDIIGVDANGVVTSNGTPATFVNSGGATGVSYNVTNGGGLKLDGTVLPGTTGSVTSPGWVSP